MIVSHKHKFIFLKTKKTAGTSIELALSKFCGLEDIITPILEEEEMRQQGSYRKAQNYMIPWYRYQFQDWKNYFSQGKKAEFFNHIKGKGVKRFLGDRIWDSYYKFCFERNPWDKCISGYYFRYKDRTSDSRPTLTEYLEDGVMKAYSSYYIYTLNHEVIVDQIFRYENLEASLQEIANRLNLPEPLQLPQVKADFRKDRRHYREVLSESNRDTIAQAFHQEIELLGYEY